MKAVIIGLIAVVFIGGGYLIFHELSTQTASSTSSQSQQAANKLSFNGSQFSPADLTVQTGTTVTIINTSSEELQMDSNPHPIHTDDTDLNVGLVSPGHSKTFVVHKKGTFGYHDHLDPNIQGTITIQ